jgi:hypothetical protein
MYANHLGAWPISASASRVREAANVEAFPTDKTEMRMTALIMCGMMGIPASWTARTKGDALTSLL